MEEPDMGNHKYKRKQALSDDDDFYMAQQNKW